MHAGRLAGCQVHNIWGPGGLCTYLFAFQYPVHMEEKDRREEKKKNKNSRNA